MKPSRYFHRILSSLYGLNNQPGVAVGAVEAVEVVEAAAAGVAEVDETVAQESEKTTAKCCQMSVPCLYHLPLNVL